MLTTAPVNHRGKESLRNYKRNHSRVGRTTSRVHSTMEQIRESITRQLEGAS